MSADCLFCRIARGEIAATRLAENAHCIAFRDIAPQAPTHVLVIPREHIASMNDVTGPEIAGELLLMARTVARETDISDTGYRIVLNTLHDGGQTVAHLHAHVLGGRAMTWPPG